MKANMASQQNKHDQRGATLIVGLIMLLLLTLIGVAGMRDTLLQQKMAANSQGRERALQAAESALRAAEVALSTPVAPAMTNSNGLYDMTTVSPTLVQRNGTEANFWTQQWGGGTWNNSNSVAYALALDSVDPANPPRYVVEQLNVALSNRSGYVTSGGACSVVCSQDLVDDYSPTPPPVSDYRITARAVGSTPDSVVLLQETFRRDKP